jgi:hypothetical protein
MTNDNARGESPGNWQILLIERTMMKHPHYPHHDMSLPLFPLVKGIRGKVWMGIEDCSTLRYHNFL